jgi:outer membrane protein TolC
MRLRTLLGLALCAAVASSAQITNPPPGIRSLSLRECVELALSKNLDLRIERLKLDMATNFLFGAYGVYDPDLSFAAQRNFVSQPSNFDPKKSGNDFPYELTTDSFGPTLNGVLPFGLSYDFSAIETRQSARTDFNSNTNTATSFPPLGVRLTNNFMASAGVTLQQHLLKDFWIDAARENILVRKKDLKISQQALRFQIMKTLLAVELAYYDLIAAREEIRVQEKALELRRQFVADTQRRVQVGDSPPLDDAQAETQLQNTLTQLAAAREVFAARQNSLVGLLTDDYKEWADVDVQPTDALQALPAEVNRFDSFQSALSKRPDLIEARLAVEKTGVMVKFQYNQLFPNLDLVGGYGGQGVDSGFNSTMNDVFGFHNPEYTYGVVVSFPLSNVSERNSYQASRAAKQIAELQFKKAEQDVLIQVADFVSSIEFRFSQVAYTHQARTYAEAALDAENKKLQNGFTTGFVVLQFQEILTTARTAEIRAEADYNKALAQLAFAEGTIMERHHLSLAVK